MIKVVSICIVSVSLALGVAACSSDNDDESSLESGGLSDQAPEPDNTGELSDQAPEPMNTGEPGGDITAIAGLWDGSDTDAEVTDVVYWNMAGNGVLTRFDYQQDGVAGATGDNCYITSDPITVSPEADDTYSIFNVAVTAVRTDQSLTITFLDPDVNDLDADGDVTETPEFKWTLLTTPMLGDLNSCTNEAFDPSPVVDDTPADSPLITRAQCLAGGNTIVGDIGNGAIHEDDYLCPSGSSPIAGIRFLDGEPIATEGEVCCPS